MVLTFSGQISGKQDKSSWAGQCKVEETSAITDPVLAGTSQRSRPTVAGNPFLSWFLRRREPSLFAVWCACVVDSRFHGNHKSDTSLVFS